MTTTDVPSTNIHASAATSRGTVLGSFTARVIAATFATVLLLALNSFLARPAGASEIGPAVSVGSAMVCDMGDSVITETESGQMIPPATCEVRTGSDASPYVAAVADLPRTSEDMATPITPTPLSPTPVSPTSADRTSVASSSALGGLGLRPTTVILVIGSIVVRLLARLLWGRRRLRF